MSPSTHAPTRAHGVGPGLTGRAATEPAPGARGDPVPGLHLVVEVAGLRALVAADLVEEVVRLVALSSVPGAAAPIAGGFVHRGEDVVAIDLAACVGVRREADLDAHVVVLRTPRRIGLVVDAVRSLVEGGSSVAERAADRWAASGLVAAQVRTAGGLEAPLLGLDPLMELVHELPDRGGEASR